MSSEFAGAGYIVELYNDLESLNGYVPQYQNFIIEVMQRAGVVDQEFDPKKIRMDIQDKQKALTIIPPIRHLIIVIRLKMSALKNKIKSFKEIDESEAFIKHYQLVVSKPSPNFEDVYEVTRVMNELFVNGIIDDLLIEAKSIYNSPGNALGANLNG